jgi:hypothetical protein
MTEWEGTEGATVCGGVNVAVGGIQTICAARGETAAEHLEPLVAAGLCMPDEAKLLAGAPDPFMPVKSPLLSLNVVYLLNFLSCILHLISSTK